MTSDSGEGGVEPNLPTDAAKPKDPVASMAGQISQLSTGDRAALRRIFLTRSRQADGIVVGLLHRAGVSDAAWRYPEAFARWRLLAHVAAVLSGTAGLAAHSPAGGFGRALQTVGYSENRLMRLTAARGSALTDQVVRAARFLAQAGATTVDLRTLRDLIGDDRTRAEAARLRIARDYYAAEYASQKESA